MSRAELHELYVYYRVCPVDAAKVQDEVRALQAELRGRFPRLAVRWLRRAAVEVPDGAAPLSQTWMEIYSHPAGLSESDIAFILQRGAEIVSGTNGPRHPEVFIPCV